MVKHVFAFMRILPGFRGNQPFTCIRLTSGPKELVSNNLQGLYIFGVMAICVTLRFAKLKLLRNVRRLTWTGVVLVTLSALPGTLTAKRSYSQEASTITQSQASLARKVLDQYCVTCHNGRLKTGGLALSDLDIEHVYKSADVWEKVVRKLRARYMPPMGRPRPDDATYTAVISYLEASLDAAAADPNPGRTDAFHRLNRTEYQNSIRDLLALDIDLTSLLPKDEPSYGFDNVNPGGISPTLLERYILAAQKVSRLAVGTPVRSPASEVVILPPDLTQEDHVEELPVGTRGGKILLHNFPRDGEYEIQLRLTRL